MAVLSAMFGALGAALAGLGLYGLLAYTVTRRTNEIGVRIALGARPATVIAMVVKSAGVLVVGGLAVGIPIAIAGRRLVEGLVTSVPVDSALPIGAAAATMILIGVFSAFVPARRAALMDPTLALRQD
jgi:ABC-type antimicrobial peptide transport system permease subunit